MKSRRRTGYIISCLKRVGIRVKWNNGYVYHAFYGDNIFMSLVDQDSRFCVTIREYDNNQFSEDDDTDDIERDIKFDDYVDYMDDHIHPIFRTDSPYYMANELKEHLKDWNEINDPLYLACKKAVEECTKTDFFSIIKKKLLEEA